MVKKQENIVKWLMGIDEKKLDLTVSKEECLWNRVGSKNSCKKHYHGYYFTDVELFFIDRAGLVSNEIRTITIQANKVGIVRSRSGN